MSQSSGPGGFTLREAPTLALPDRQIEQRGTRHVRFAGYGGCINQTHLPVCVCVCVFIIIYSALATINYCCNLGTEGAAG